MGNHVTTEEISNYQIAANEFLNRVIMPEGCERAGKPIHSETVIFDCTNMSLWRKFIWFHTTRLNPQLKKKSFTLSRISYECHVSFKSHC